MIVPPQLSAALSAYRQSAFNPVAELEPAVLAQQLTQFRAGTLAPLALTMDAIEERDDVISGLAPKAKAAVARHGYEIKVVEKIPPGMEQLAARQKDALEYFWNSIRVGNAAEPDEEGEFSLLARQVMDAKGKRYSVHHIVWRHESGRYAADIIHVPLWFFENRTGPMRFIQTPYGYDGVPMEPGAWSVAVGLGIMRACSVAWMFKRMSLQDWVGYGEKYGFPGVHGQTNAAYGSPEWDQMVAAVASFSRDWSAVTNMEGKINLITAGGSGQLPFQPLVERMDRALSALWRGADLSTMSAGGGEGTGASLQGDEALLIEQDDAAWVSETLRRKIERPFLDYTFGEGVPALAYVKILTAIRKNTALDLQIDAFAVANGHPVSQKQFAERYDRPLPDAVDALLKAAPGVPAPSPFGGVAINEQARAAAEAAGVQAQLADNTAKATTRALLEKAKPVLAELRRAAESADDAAYDAAMAKAAAALRAHAAKLGLGENDPVVVAIYRGLSAAAVNGAAAAAEARKP